MNNKSITKLKLLTARIGVILMIMIMIAGYSSVSAQDTNYELDLSFTNLVDPGDDHYEGWLIIGGTPKSTGKFTLDNNGAIIDLNGNSIDHFMVSYDASMASKFVLTLEPMGDTDTTPADIKPIAGDISNMAASLSHNIGVDLSASSGEYILATPTNGADTNENSGIWWLDPTGGSPVASLDLPDLSGTDWIYEGWVVVNGTPVTSGTFDKPSGADDTDIYSGVEAAPPFPGEDFLNNAPTGLNFPTDLSGGKAVISVEPRNDNSPAPFQFKPLVGDIPMDATDHTLYSVSNMASTLPTGSLMISEVPEMTSTTPTSNSATDDNVSLELVAMLGVVTLPILRRRRN